MPLSLRPMAVACLTLLATPALAAPAQPAEFGTWRNPSNSVHIRTARCGAALCGTVVWASPKAQADVRAATGRKLVGTQLFRRFTRGPDGVWSGTVYVPDLDKEFSGTIALDGRDTLVGKGCLLGNLACKEQRWQRMR